MRRIYKLTDPRNGEIRYVGQTCSPLNKRLNSHVCNAKKKWRIYHSAAWINELTNQGYRPIIEELESGDWDDDYTNLREATWIFVLREFDNDLTNHYDGGGVYTGYRTSDETKKLLSSLGVQYNCSLAVRQAKRTAQINYWHGNDRARTAVARQTAARWTDPNYKARATLQTVEYRTRRSAIAKDIAQRPGELQRLSDIGKLSMKIKRRCLDCSYTGSPPHMGTHLKHSKHSGYSRIKAGDHV